MAELPVIKRLKKDLETLKHELTVDLPKELERARAHGDLSENAEWAMAKQRQEFLRARVGNLETRIAELTMIDLETIPRDTVGLGSRVRLEDLDEGGIAEFEIVVPEEVDGAQNRISLSSPLGRALIGKAAEDDIEVVTPEGQARVHGEGADDDPRADGRRERQQIETRGSSPRTPGRGDPCTQCTIAKWRGRHFAPVLFPVSFSSCVIQSEAKNPVLSTSPK